MAVAGSAAALQPEGGATHKRLDQPITLEQSDQCIDAIQIAPVIQMTKAGNTLLGPSMSTVMIYSNGLVTMSSVDPRGGGSGAQMLHVDRRDVMDLQADLAEIGAGSICDAQTTVFDVPLTTVSVSRGASDSMTHSYSYWLAEGRQADVESAILDFIMNSSIEK